MNIGDHAGNENGVPFLTVPAGRHQNQVRWARTKAFWITRNIPRANAYFLTLPAGRSLTNLLDDNTIWINYDPTINYDGFTFSNNDLWIGPGPFRIGRWQVLATLIHELAHIGGAVGGAAVCGAFSGPCHAAERAVFECGMGRNSELNTGVDNPETPYNPNIFG